MNILNHDEENADKFFEDKDVSVSRMAKKLKKKNPHSLPSTIGKLSAAIFDSSKDTFAFLQNSESKGVLDSRFIYYIYRQMIIDFETTHYIEKFKHTDRSTDLGKALKSFSE
mmetsp:Transcript_33862/g.39063  ORF Transcript_33862/g.39063 Transcript_33862/m.39063 type:complete len:112 (-) Transcript_33862:795-1130(-)